RFQIMLPLLVILAVRRGRILLGVAPVAAVLTAISIAMLGWRGVVGYVRLILSEEHSSTGGPVGPGMPNVRGIVESLPGVHGGSVGALGLTLGASLAVFVFAIWRIRDTTLSEEASFVVATLAAVLVSYHALDYDLTLLLPAILLMFAVSHQATKWEA